MRPVFCDWDNTLVDVKTKEWLPGAVEALRFFKRNHDLVIWTARAQWPEGRQEIVSKLLEIGFREGKSYSIVSKPDIVAVIDDRAHAFTSWSDFDWSDFDLEALNARRT